MPSILNHVTVVRDGMHNAFTSLAYWQGAYWVAYRKGPWHGYSADSCVNVAVSDDRTRFREVARLKVPGDNRDPRFVVLAEDKLALLFPSLIIRADVESTIQQFISFSRDGYNWEPPMPILEPKHHLFRVRRHEELFYGLDCYRDGAIRRLRLWVSADLLVWRPICWIGEEEHKLNESDICFRPNGEAWIIARTLREPDHAILCRAQPPYTEWELTDLKSSIHAPAMLEHEGKVYVAGRGNPREEGETAWPFGRSLCIWEVVEEGVRPVLRIPATGDCSYPGLIKDSAGRICMSYYSQHAYHLGVLLPFSARGAEMPQAASGVKTPMAADVYFVELQLP